MKKIKTALISLSDKSNLKPLLNSLKKNNIKIISSGGTFTASITGEIIPPKHVLLRPW